MDRLIVRRCRAHDLAVLEWDGEFSHDRHTIEWSFARMLEGTMTMLVAEAGGEHVGQVWLDFARSPDRAHLWALRVKPRWRRGGIGSHLLAAADRACRRYGLSTIELEVEVTNPARRLYERCGYAAVRSELVRDHRGELLGTGFVMMRKSLAPPAAALTPCAPHA